MTTYATETDALNAVQHRAAQHILDQQGTTYVPQGHTAFLIGGAYVLPSDILAQARITR